jgi:hypothetical protein
MRTENVRSMEPPSRGIDGDRPCCSALIIPLLSGSKNTFRHSILWLAHANICSIDVTTGLGPHRSAVAEPAARDVARAAAKSHMGRGGGSVLIRGGGAGLPNGIDDDDEHESNSMGST